MVSAKEQQLAQQTAEFRALAVKRLGFRVIRWDHARHALGNAQVPD